MAYTLYLYKSSAYSDGVLALDDVNWVLGTYKNQENWGDAETFMMHFDFSSLLSEMDNLIALNEDGTKKYQVHILSSPTAHIEYLAICTSFEKIREIADCIRGIAIKHLVTIYDPQLEKYYFPNEPRRDQYARVKKREKELLAIIREGNKFCKSIILKYERWRKIFLQGRMLPYFCRTLHDYVCL